MEPSAAKSSAISEQRRQALLTLLGDEDRSISDRARDEILGLGRGAIEVLRSASVHTDPLIRRRSQRLLQKLEKEAADAQFLEFCLKHGEEFEIEEGLWRLSRTQYPEINVEAYQALLDSYATTLRDRLEAAPEPRRLIATINEFLFDELGFRGNEQNYYEPENSYLNRVLDRRTGNPISLSLVYLMLARRLKLPMVGVGMPGHFICRFQSPAGALFVDAFNHGKVLTKSDCVSYLLQSNYGFSESYLVPATPRRVLLRVCSNLHQSYRQLDMRAEAERFQRYIVALARS
jgi:regulator of sirC expression with transglutaminase-like and TPR domain